MEKRCFCWKNVWYIYTTKMVDTHYGPERQLTLWQENHPSTTTTVQECGTVQQCIYWALEALGVYDVA